MQINSLGNSRLEDCSIILETITTISSRYLREAVVDRQTAFSQKVLKFGVNTPRDM